MRLGVQGDATHAPLPRALDECVQNRCADAPSPPLGQHGHPANPRVWKQSSRPDRAPSRVAGDGVVAHRVEVVPLEFDRHPLLDDKDRLPHRSRIGVRRVPIDHSDLERRRQARLLARV